MKFFRNTLRWTGIVLAGLAGILLIAYSVIYYQTEKRFNARYLVDTPMLRIPQDSASIALGGHLYQIKGCQDCHGANLSGKVFLDDPALGRIVATNLTRGKGGRPIEYSDGDWLRALKHGVDADGKPLLLMPSHETTRLSNQDLTALIAYCQNQPAVDNELPAHSVGPLGRILMAFDKIPMLSAEKIDHHAKATADMQPTVSMEYGAYLAVSCVGCHRENLEGGDPLAPGFPPVPNITSTGKPGKWTEEQFIRTLRTGKTPEGKVLKNEDMPWQMTRQYTDVELKALRLYLITLPKKQVAGK
jgi:mono/diheme cytochrome c family protein